MRRRKLSKMVSILLCSALLSVNALSNISVAHASNTAAIAVDDDNMHQEEADMDGNGVDISADLSDKDNDAQNPASDIESKSTQNLSDGTEGSMNSSSAQELNDGTAGQGTQSEDESEQNVSGDNGEQGSPAGDNKEDLDSPDKGDQGEVETPIEEDEDNKDSSKGNPENEDSENTDDEQKEDGNLDEEELLDPNMEQPLLDEEAAMEAQVERGTFEVRSALELLWAVKSVHVNHIVLKKDIDLSLLSFFDLNIIGRTLTLDGENHTITVAADVNIKESDIILKDITFDIRNPYVTNNKWVGINVVDSTVQVEGTIRTIKSGLNYRVNNFVLTNSRLTSGSDAVIDTTESASASFKVYGNSSINAPKKLSIYSKKNCFEIFGKNGGGTVDRVNIGGNLYLSFERTGIYSYDYDCKKDKMTLELNIEDNTNIEFICRPSVDNETQPKGLFIGTYNTTIGNDCTFYVENASVAIMTCYKAIFGNNFNLTHKTDSGHIGMDLVTPIFGDNAILDIRGSMDKGINFSAGTGNEPTFKNFIAGKNFTLKMDLKPRASSNSLIGFAFPNKGDINIGEDAKIHINLDTTGTSVAAYALYSSENGNLRVDKNADIKIKSDYFARVYSTHFSALKGSIVVIDLSKRLYERDFVGEVTAGKKSISLINPYDFDIRQKESKKTAGLVQIWTNKGFALWTEDRYLSPDAPELPWDMVYNDTNVNKEYLIDPVSKEDYFITGGTLFIPSKDFYRISHYSTVDVKYVDIEENPIEEGAFDKKVFAYQGDTLLLGDDTKIGNAPAGYYFPDPDKDYKIDDINNPILVVLKKDMNITLEVKYMDKKTEVGSETIHSKDIFTMKYSDLNAPEGYKLKLDANWSEDISVSKEIIIPVTKIKEGRPNPDPSDPPILYPDDSNKDKADNNGGSGGGSKDENDGGTDDSGSDNVTNPVVPEELPPFIEEDDNGDYWFIDDDEVPLGNAELTPGSDPMDKDSWTIAGNESDDELDDVPRTGEATILFPVSFIFLLSVIIIYRLTRKKSEYEF